MFLVNVPIWGDRCWKIFIDSGWPALVRAAVGHQCRYLVHTDDEPLAQHIFLGHEAIINPVPPGTVGGCERQAIELARDGEYVCLLNSDMVMSVETFTATARRLAAGKKMVCCATLRTGGLALPPVGASSRDLLSWAWANRHEHIVDTTWGTMNTSSFTHLHFERDGNVILRTFFLHPWCVVKEARTGFSSVTADWDLAERFTLDELHIVTDVDELGFAELSPLGWVVNKSPYNINNMVEWAASKALPSQKYMFRQRICLVGQPADCGDNDICDGVIKAYS